MTNNFMYSGCICCYNSCNFDKIMLCCKGSCECLCLVHEHCLAAGEEPLGVGMVTDEGNQEICKLGLYCCTCGLKTPEVLISGASQCLCLQDAASFPFDKDYVGEAVCAYCFIQCLPEFGCMKPPPDCPALHKLEASTTPANEVMGR